MKAHKSGWRSLGAALFMAFIATAFPVQSVAFAEIESLSVDFNS
jgi:hypothetical protein